MSTSVVILTSLCQAFAVNVRIIPCVAILNLPKSQNDHQQFGDHFDPFVINKAVKISLLIKRLLYIKTYAVVK